MRYDVLLKIKSDPNALKFLRENSEWYKILNRDPNKYDDMINLMKEKYQLRVSDKLDKLSTGLDLISLFIDSND